MCSQEPKEGYRVEGSVETSRIPRSCSTRQDTRSFHLYVNHRASMIIKDVADKNHLVNVESAGQYSPEELVPEAIKILLGKIKDVEEGLDKLFATEGQAA